MTATERLRELLDEREVEWTSGSTEVSRDKYTDFYPDSGIVVGVWERGDGKLGIDAHTTYRFTPEQAVAATLGSGTCRDIALEGEWFECSECRTVKQLIHPNYCPNCGRKVV